MHIFAMTTIAWGSVVLEKVTSSVVDVYVAKLYPDLEWEKVKKVHHRQAAQREAKRSQLPRGTDRP